MMGIFGARGTGRALWLFAAAALLLGIAIGRWGSPGAPAVAADGTPNATATRAAELDELNRLRTQVAQPAICAPAATATPTATPSPEPTATQVPAAAAETPLAYRDGWTITVHDIHTAPPPDGLKVSGQLVVVTMTLENRGDDALAPPLSEWRLVDGAGRRYKPSTTATERVGTHGYGVPIAAHSSDERKVVFDIAADAGTSFVLESTKDPSFRVQVDFEARG